MREGSAPDLGDQILDPAVVKRRRRFRRMVVGVMTGAVGLLVVAGVCRANRASLAEEEAARYTAPRVEVAPALAEAVAAPAELQDTHGGGPPTSPNAARFHRPKSDPSTHKPRNASVLPR